MNAVTRLADFDDPTFDPFIADELMFGSSLDPYPKLAELRAKGPVHKLDYRVFMGEHADATSGHLPHYVVVGYEEVVRCLTEPETFSNEAYKLNLGISFGRSVSTMDPPEHPRYRRIFQKAFLPQTVAKWGESVVDPVVNSLMEKFQRRGSADLVQEFTLHYPFQIVYRQLDCRPRKAPRSTSSPSPRPSSPTTWHTGLRRPANLVITSGCSSPSGSGIPAPTWCRVLAQAEVDGERLPEEIMISFLRQLVNAGGDTTYRGTSVLLTGLLSNPEQLEAVRKDRSLVPQAIEEALRWDGPVLIQTRMAAKDVELGGVKIPKGAVLDVAAGAANRDPDRFPNPDRFDIFRKPQHKHLAFAYGPHVCIGQHLARVEMTRALNAILDNLHNLRLDPDKPAPEIRGIMMRVPKHLYVRFDQ